MHSMPQINLIRLHITFSLYYSSQKLHSETISGAISLGYYQEDYDLAVAIIKDLSAEFNRFS